MPKYYAVARGRKVGIYDNWPDAKEHVSDYPYAKFKSFTSKKSFWRKTKEIMKTCKRGGFIGEKKMALT